MGHAERPENPDEPERTSTKRMEKQRTRTDFSDRVKPEQTAANPSFCCICYYCCLVIKPPFADFVIPTKTYPSITAQQRHHKTCPFFPPTFENTLLNTGERMHRSISLLCVQDRARMQCSSLRSLLLLWTKTSEPGATV